MQIEKKMVSKTKVKFSVVVPALTMNDLFEKEYEKMAPTVNLPGFRPGKAPRAMAIEAIGLNRLANLAIERALNEGYMQALKEHNVFPVNQPAVSVSKNPSFLEGANNELTFEIEFDIITGAKIGDWKKIKADRPDPKKIEVTDEEVDKVIDFLSRQAATLNDKGGVAEKGDWVEISFSGEVAHVKKDALTSNNFPMVIGETKMIDGFAEKLIGMKKGETKEFELALPKDIPDRDIAGKKAKFSVELIETKEIIKPKIDNEFADKFGHKTVVALKAAIKKSLVDEKTEKETQEIKGKISEQIIKLTKVDIPASMIADEAVRLKQSLVGSLKERGADYNSYLKSLNLSEEKMTKDLEDQAKKNIILGVGLSEIAKTEKIDISEGAGTDKIYERILEVCAK